jgi:hypothetical protein
VSWWGIREIPGSNLGLETSSLPWNFRGISQLLKKNARVMSQITDRQTDRQIDRQTDK